MTGLAERQDLVAQVAAIKAGGDDVFRDPSREQAILTRLVGEGKKHGLDPFFVTRLFREIIEHSVRVQQVTLATGEGADQAELVVAYQGTEGAYSHLAAQRHFSARPEEVRFVGYDSFKGILEAVRDGEAHYAVLPIENTTAGSINEAYDLLARMDLSLVGEEIQPVEHCLLALEPVPLSRIRRVFSHPQALAQCHDFLSTLRDCHVEAFTDTAMAARKIRDEQDMSQAAIASGFAAELYGLHVLKRGIANQRENFTRMVIVAAEQVTYDLRIACKTSLVLVTRHEKGALVSCMNVLASHGLNLTKLESRPRPHAPWEYLFYIDLEGNVADPNVAEALKALASMSSFLKVLGSYPARTGETAAPAEPLPVPGLPSGVEARGERPTHAPTLQRRPLDLAGRGRRDEDTVVPVGAMNPVMVGGVNPLVMVTLVDALPGGDVGGALLAQAKAVKSAGGHLLRMPPTRHRGGPREDEREAQRLQLLDDASQAAGLPLVAQVHSPQDLAKVVGRADLLEIGPSQMEDFPLLDAVGKVARPVLLHRGPMASVEDWLGAAEHILQCGNQMVILAESGIRTFETLHRRTLDLAAVAAIRGLTHLPVLVSLSAESTHASVLPRVARAAIAAGAAGVIVEVSEHGVSGTMAPDAVGSLVVSH